MQPELVREACDSRNEWSVCKDAVAMLARRMLLTDATLKVVYAVHLPAFRMIDVSLYERGWQSFVLPRLLAARGQIITLTTKLVKSYRHAGRPRLLEYIITSQ